MITRNHSVANNLHPNTEQPLLAPNTANSIEVKHVSEEEIANIFTFYNAQKTDEAHNLNAEKQFTFQASLPSVTME